MDFYSYEWNCLLRGRYMLGFLYDGSGRRGGITD